MHRLKIYLAAVRNLAGAVRAPVLFVACVLAAYYAVNSLFLGNATAEQRALGEILSMTAALVVMTVAAIGAVYGRWVPPLGETFGGPAELPEAQDGFRREAQTRGFLGLRWIAVIAMAAVVFFVDRIGGQVSDRAGVILWVLVGALASFNSGLSILGTGRLQAPRATALQIGADVLVLGVAVHHAGGVSNPFAVFFVFHAVIASLMLSPALARRVTGLIALFVAALTIAEVSGVLSAVPLASRAAAGLLAGRLQLGASGLAIVALSVGCGFVVTTLVGWLQRDRASLRDTTQKLRDEADQLATARIDLLAETEKLTSVMDCMSDAMVFVTSDGQVPLHNPAAAALWPDGLPASGIDLGADGPDQWDRLRHIISHPHPATAHPPLRIGDRAFDASYARVCHRSGELLGVVIVARDVTDRLAEQDARIQGARMATIGRLAAALAHELNNPLGAMVLFTEQAIDEAEAGGSLSEHLGTVLRNAKSCKKIVRDLLTYARQRAPERQFLSPKELMDDVIRTLSPQCARRSVKIDAAISPTIGADVYGDPDQLRQMLVNLGLNAIDAMPDGGDLRFSVNGLENGGIRMDVIDTGLGIEPAEQERIFAAFYTTKAQGTGLGLAVVRDLVAAHGGALELSSIPDEGSTFSVVLPRVEPGAPVGALA